MKALYKLFFSRKEKEVPKKVERILLFKLGAMGDVLMTTPLIRDLRNKFPKAKIDYYVGKPYANVINDNMDLDEVVPFDQTIFFDKKFSEVKKLKHDVMLKKYDMAFVLDKHWIISVFMGMAKIPFVVGFDRNGEGFANNLSVPYNDVKHEIDYYIELGDLVGAKNVSHDIDYFITKKSKDFASKMFRDTLFSPSSTICIVPGGANNPGVGDDPIRRLSTDKYIELINQLVKDYFVILLGGPDDKKISYDIFNQLSDTKRVYNLTGKTSIDETAAVMAKSKWVVCNDSGPMHLASAVNESIISIFGPTHPQRKAPLTRRSYPLWKDEDIYDPNYELYGKKPKHEHYMENISADDILEIINDN